MILQLGVKASWFNTCSTTLEKRPHLIPGTASYTGDLRSYMIDLPPVGDAVVPEMLLKVLEPYRKEGGSFVLDVVFLTMNLSFWYQYLFFLTCCQYLFAQGCILDDERAKLYAKIVNKGCAARFAFAAAIFGESSEALFWLQLPRALNYLINKLVNKSPQKVHVSASTSELDDTALLKRITSKERSMPGKGKKDALVSHFAY